jgi:hypothetical protein
MMTVNHVTAHARIDRIDRITFIAERIGWGKEVLRVNDRHDPNNIILILTSTGVVLVKERHTDTLITAYVATIQRADAFYWQVKQKPVPDKLRHRIVNNYGLCVEFGL